MGAGVWGGTPHGNVGTPIAPTFPLKFGHKKQSHIFERVASTRHTQKKTTPQSGFFINSRLILTIGNRDLTVYTS